MATIGQEKAARIARKNAGLGTGRIDTRGFNKVSGGVYEKDGNQINITTKQVTKSPVPVTTGVSSTTPIDEGMLGSSNPTVIPALENNNTSQIAMNAKADSLAENFIANPTEIPEPSTETNQRNSILQSIQSLITKQGEQGTRTEELNKEQDVINKQTIARNLENDYISKQRAYDKQIEKIRQNSAGRESAGVDAEIGRVERLKNSELADIAIQYKIANGAYTDAVGIVEAQIKAEFEPLQNQINSLGNLYQLYADDLTESEKMRVQAVIDERQTKLDQQYQAARDAKLHQYNLSEGGVGTGTGGQYTNDLDAIIGATLSSIPTQFGQQTFNQQIGKSRNDADKINLIATQVLKGQPAEFKRDFANQAVGINSIDKAIAELDKGAQTGFLNNAAQYTFNVFGKDFDPKLQKVQGYITAAIQPYRNSVTGAAWGEQEDAEYAQLFGSTKYSPAELKQRLVNIKEILKSKSAQGLNAFVNPLGYYGNQFESGDFTPSGQGQITVQSNGQSYIVGQVYNDGNADWVVDADGNWHKQ